MDHGGKNEPTSTIPRVKVFDQQLISSLIMANCFGLRGVAPTRVFGRGQVPFTFFSHETNN